MYVTLAILALFIFFYSMVAGRIERSAISGPMVFVVAGFLMGPFGLGWLSGDATSADLRTLADLTLALILFIDAANADMSILKKQFRIPSRMLLLGLPGVIALGFGFAVLIFDGLSLIDAAILATMLAATDAALGKAVITNKAVPARIREGLNVESGLNDGICVPILLFFIALSVGGEHGGSSAPALRLLATEIGIGMAVGMGLALVGVSLLRWCVKQGWVTEIWKQVTVAALALSSFAIAQSLHGSGYIAAFTGGLLFGFLAKEAAHKLVMDAEGIGETLALVTWMLFGAMVIGPAFKLFSWEVVVYALLSLTVIRVAPIFLSLAGTGESISSRLFLGWFGPRGLASIVFAIIVINAGVPGADVLALVVICTVFLSLVAHGISAHPLARWLGRKESSDSNQQQ
ncbi:MAG: sodium:proton antiporter [Gammaproteobacteria bacterium]|nr:MAG: sodium:proton antiporter [Gammaproteobacteria bacterium]RLA36945.1 MAG: sodium:proton antiporter [Gammaproteobacteria bacterium]